MLDRFVGLETEYVLRFHPRRPGGRRVPNGELYRRLLDRLRARGPLAPSVAGHDCWFRANGGGLRFEQLPFYSLLPASGFVEGATPECRGPWELLRYQRAQDVLLSRDAASSGGADGDVTLLKASHDADGHLFGSHENYEATIADGPGLWAWRVALVPALVVLVLVISFGDVAALLLGPPVAAAVAVAGRLLGRDPGRTYSVVVAWLFSLCRAPGQLVGSAFLGLMAFRRMRRRLLAFLVSRTILSGPGMVCRDGRFVLSARADAIRSTCGVTAAAWRSVFYFCHFMKAVASPAEGIAGLLRRRQRLQVTIGDSNMAQHAEFLKLGTTLLVLDVIEAGGLDDAPRLRRPLRALRAFSGDPDLRAAAPLADGRRVGALEIQRFYLDACRRFVGRHAAGDALAAEVLRLWHETLDALGRDPSRLVGRLDWVTKRHLLDAAGPSASADERRKLDMRYHELSPEGYYLRLEAAGVAPVVAEPEEIVAAIDHPPEGSPAAARGRLIRQSAESGNAVRVGWSSAVVTDARGTRVVRLDER
jgi:proteasome accessory factor A